MYSTENENKITNTNYKSQKEGLPAAHHTITSHDDCTFKRYSGVCVQLLGVCMCLKVTTYGLDKLASLKELRCLRISVKISLEYRSEKSLIITSTCNYLTQL